MSDIRTLPNEPGSGPTIVLFPVPLSGGETGPDLVRDGVKHAAFCKLGSIPNFTVQNGNWWAVIHGFRGRSLVFSNKVLKREGK